MISDKWRKKTPPIILIIRLVCYLSGNVRHTLQPLSLTNVLCKESLAFIHMFYSCYSYSLDQKHNPRPTERTEDIFLAREGVICRAWLKLHPCRSNMAFSPRLCVSISMEMISDVIRLTMNTWKADQSFGFHCPADRQSDACYCTFMDYNQIKCTLKSRVLQRG